MMNGIAKLRRMHHNYVKTEPHKLIESDTQTDGTKDNQTDRALEDPYKKGTKQTADHKSRSIIFAMGGFLWILTRTHLNLIDVR